MAKSTSNKSRKIWRGVLVGAAVVPLALFASAPSVGAAETDHTETTENEQLPGVGDLPGGLPDPQALLDLQACLTELQALVGDTAGDVPDPDQPDPGLPDDPGLPVPGLPIPLDDAESELLPGLPGAGDLPVELPDIGALNEVCQTVLGALQDAAPDLPDTELPDPGLPDDPGLPVPGLP